MEAVGTDMFCPGCGEMANIREGDGESYYKRIESSINPYRQDYENDKPKMEDYNPEDLSRKIPREDEITLVDAPVSEGTPLRRKKKSDYQIDYDDWKALDEFVPRYKNVDKGEQLEKKGVKYSTCNNPYCNYSGPAAKIKKDGKEIEFDDLKSVDTAETRKYEVIKDSDKMQGILTKDTYMCSKRIDGKSCDSTEVYAYLEQTRSSDEPETRMLTCKTCGHGWREY